MINKILTGVILVIVLFTYSINTSADEELKKLVIVSGKETSLEYEGYDMIETNVNYQVEGIYSAVYVNKETKNTVSRIIEVVNEEHLVEGINEVKQEHIIEYEGYELYRTVIIPNGYVSLGVKEGRSYFIFDTNEVMKYYVMGKVEKLSIIDLCYDEQSQLIYGIGNYYTSGEVDIYLIVFTCRGICVRINKYGGSQPDEILSFLVLANEIVLCGKTRSSDGDFIHSANREDSFLLYIDKKSGTVTKYLNYGKEGVDYIDSLIYMDALYVIQHYYYSNVPICKIIKIGDSYEEKKVAYLDSYTLVTCKGLTTDGDNLYLFCDIYDPNYNDNKSYLYQINPELQIEEIDSYYEKNSASYDISILGGEIKLLYYDLKKQLPYLRIIDDDRKRRIDLIIQDVDKFYCIGSQKICLIGEGKASLYHCHHLEINWLDEYTPNLYENGILMNYHHEKSKTDVNPNLFGWYDLEFYYEFSEYDILYTKKIKIKNNLNIANNNTYQIGLIITFNANGFLNNYRIESGYQINEVGTYRLELIGNNEIKEIYTFDVANLTSDKNDLELPSYEIIIPNDALENTSILNQSITDNLLITKDYDKGIWYILIPITTLLLMSILYFKTGGKIQ